MLHLPQRPDFPTGQRRHSHTSPAQQEAGPALRAAGKAGERGDPLLAGGHSAPPGAGGRPPSGPRRQQRDRGTRHRVAERSPPKPPRRRRFLPRPTRSSRAGQDGACVDTRPPVSAQVTNHLVGKNHTGSPSSRFRNDEQGPQSPLRSEGT